MGGAFTYPKTQPKWDPKTVWTTTPGKTKPTPSQFFRTLGSAPRWRAQAVGREPWIRVGVFSPRRQDGITASCTPLGGFGQKGLPFRMIDCGEIGVPDTMLLLDLFPNLHPNPGRHPLCQTVPRDTTTKHALLFSFFVFLYHGVVGCYENRIGSFYVCSQPPAPALSSSQKAEAGFLKIGIGEDPHVGWKFFGRKGEKD